MLSIYPSEVISNSGQRVQGSSRLHLQRYHCSRTNLGSEGYLSTMAVKEAWILACVEGRPFYRPPGNPVLVGSGSYSPTQQGIPTHRYGGPAALKVEFMESANMLGARPSTRSHPAHSSVMYVGSEQCSYFAYFEQSTEHRYIISIKGDPSELHSGSRPHPGRRQSQYSWAHMDPSAHSLAFRGGAEVPDEV